MERQPVGSMTEPHRRTAGGWGRTASRAISRLRLSARLGLLVAVLLVPTVVATWSFAGVMGAQVAFSASERDGVIVLAPALEALTATVVGDVPDLAAVRAAVASRPALALTGPMSAVETSATAATTAEGRAELAACLVDLISAVGNNSNLILDPDLDSFYLMDALVVQVPKVLLVASGVAVPPSGSAATQVATRAVSAGQLTGAAAALKSGLANATSRSADGQVVQDVRGLDAAVAAVEELASTLTLAMTRPTAVDPAPAALAVGQGSASTIEALDRLLQTRIDGLTQRRFVTLAITLASLLVALLWAAAVVASSRTDVSLALSSIQAIASGNLLEHAVPTGRDEFGDIGRALASARIWLQATVADVSQTAQTVSTAAEELSATNSQISANANDTTAQAATVATAAERVNLNVQTVASGAEQMGAAIHEIAQSATKAATVATAATRVAASTTDIMTTLGASSAQIGLVVQAITSIASQTNLLALNATIEAARAGAAGKGFAVVAGEVKELARETAQATQDITQRVEAMRAEATDAIAAIGEISDIIASINDHQRSIASAVEEQTATTNQMSHSVVQAATGSADIAVTITAVASSSTNSSELFAQIDSSVNDIARLSDSLRERMAGFTF